MQLVRGVGSIVAPNKVQVQGEKGVETINTKNILIATGSEVTPFPGVTVSNTFIMHITHFLTFVSSTICLQKIHRKQFTENTVISEFSANTTII